MERAEGYFPAGSLLRHVQSHRAVGQTYGQRALVVGATHPVPYVGTSSSTTAKERPFQRLAARAEAFEAVILGDRREADRVLRRVHAMHARVQGVLEELWQEWIRFGELFGMPRRVAPATVADLDRWLGAHPDGPRFHVTDEARVVGRAIALDMPVPRRVRAGTAGTGLVVVGLLPPRVRAAFGFAWTPAHRAAFRAATAGVRGSQRVLPDRVRRGRNTELFRLVARTERRILAAGGRTIDLPGQLTGSPTGSGTGPKTWWHAGPAQVVRASRLRWSSATTAA